MNSLHHSIFLFDRTINTFFINTHFPLWLIDSMIFLTYLANPLSLIIFQILLIIILTVVHKRYIAALFAGALIITEIVGLILKDIFERTRPVEVLYNVSHPGFSFPSNHALVATVFYGFFGFCLVHVAKTKSEKNLITIATTLLIFLIGFSRVFLGVHWASDVLGGWLFGTIILYFLILVYTSIHERLYKPK